MTVSFPFPLIPHPPSLLHLHVPLQPPDQSPSHLRIPATANLDWDAAYLKAVSFVAQLNASEKVNLVTGGYDAGPCIGNIGPVSRLGFKGLCFSDGPIGVNRADLVSVFPSGITAVAMWDRELLYQRGVAIGSEFRGKGAHVMLG